MRLLNMRAVAVAVASIAMQAWAVSGLVASFEGGKYAFSGGSNVIVHTITNDAVTGTETVYQRSGSTVHSPAMNTCGTHCAFMRSTESGSYVTVVPVGRGDATSSAVDVARISDGSVFGHLFWCTNGDIIYFVGLSYELHKVTFTGASGATRIESKIHGLFQYEPQGRYFGVSGTGTRLACRVYGNDYQGSNKISEQYKGPIPTDPTIRIGPKAPGFTGTRGCGNGVSASGEWECFHQGSGHEVIGFQKFDGGGEYAMVTYTDLCAWLGANFSTGGDGNRYAVNSDQWITNLAGIPNRDLENGADMLIINRDVSKKKAIKVTKNFENSRRAYPFIGSFWVSTREEVNADLRHFLDNRDSWREYWDKAIKGLAAQPPATAVSEHSRSVPSSTPAPIRINADGSIAGLSAGAKVDIGIYNQQGQMVSMRRGCNVLTRLGSGTYFVHITEVNGREQRRYKLRYSAVGGGLARN